MADRLINDENFGAWVVKCNPEVYALDDMIEDGGSLGSWSVSDNYRSARMSVGDPIVLWISGSQEPGVWGIGTVTGSVAGGSGVPLRCPLCNGEAVLPILWGMPMDDPGPGVILGGCVVGEQPWPTHGCSSCSWRGSVAEALAG
jgi:hypothetical protein